MGIRTHWKRWIIQNHIISSHIFWSTALQINEVLLYPFSKISAMTHIHGVNVAGKLHFSGYLFTYITKKSVANISSLVTSVISSLATGFSMFLNTCFIKWLYPSIHYNSLKLGCECNKVPSNQDQTGPTVPWQEGRHIVHSSCRIANGRGKPMFWECEKKMPLCHSAHHKSHTVCPGTVPSPLQ